MTCPLEITLLIEGIPLWLLGFPLTALATAITFILNDRALTPLYIIGVFIGIQTVLHTIKHAIN